CAGARSAAGHVALAGGAWGGTCAFACFDVGSWQFAFCGAALRSPVTGRRCRGVGPRDADGLQYSRVAGHARGSARRFTLRVTHGPLGATTKDERDRKSVV